MNQVFTEIAGKGTTEAPKPTREVKKDNQKFVKAQALRDVGQSSTHLVSNLPLFLKMLG